MVPLSKKRSYFVTCYISHFQPFGNRPPRDAIERSVSQGRNGEEEDEAEESEESSQVEELEEDEEGCHYPEPPPEVSAKALDVFSVFQKADVAFGDDEEDACGSEKAILKEMCNVVWRALET